MALNDIPAEDLGLCKHRWRDLYNGAGVARNDKNTALVAFFCEKCLDIRIRAYNQSRFQLTELHESNEEEMS